VVKARQPVQRYTIQPIGDSHTDEQAVS